MRIVSIQYLRGVAALMVVVFHLQPQLERMQAGFTPEVRFQVSQWLTVVSMVAKGMGVAIVPQCLAACGIGARFVPLASEAASPVQCMWLERGDSATAHAPGASQALIASALQHIQRCIVPKDFSTQ